MIWFHLVSLNYWQQLCYSFKIFEECCDLISSCIFELLTTTQRSSFRRCGCCDLISSCIFELLTTTDKDFVGVILELWFDFILYLWIIDNNPLLNVVVGFAVVIWFHLVSLNYWQQQYNLRNGVTYSCDLISSCIFELLTTTLLTENIRLNQLWFDFILYLWIIDNNSMIFRKVL